MFNRNPVITTPTKEIDRMTSLKTPLRYPGGKSRAVKKMAEFFPLFKDYKEFREPFLVEVLWHCTLH